MKHSPAPALPEQSDHQVSELTASDGYRLHYRHWSAHGEPRGSIVALHGIQSHSGWYLNSSREFAAAGWNVFYLDRRGSGLNGTERGHAVHADRLVNDVAQLLMQVRYSQSAGLPVILSAVSWGGRLGAVVAGRRPELVDRLVLMCPGIYGRVGPRPDQKLMLKLALAGGLSRHRVPIPLNDSALFTSSRSRQRFIADDPLTLREITTSLVQAGLDLERAARAAAEELRLPTLLLLAGRDRIIDNSRTRRWFERLAADRKKLIEYGTAEHTLEFEKNCEFVDDLIVWLSHEESPPELRAAAPPRFPTPSDQSSTRRRGDAETRSKT